MHAHRHQGVSGTEPKLIHTQWPMNPSVIGTRIFSERSASCRFADSPPIHPQPDAAATARATLLLRFPVSLPRSRVADANLSACERC